MPLCAAAVRGKKGAVEALLAAGARPDPSINVPDTVRGVTLQVDLLYMFYPPQPPVFTFAPGPQIQIDDMLHPRVVGFAG